jgi:hypothetical protein
MDISKELSELGLTEELLAFFHSRTANRSKEIEKAWISRASYPAKGFPKKGDPLKASISLKGGGTCEYTLEIAKIRQKRINMLMNKQ